MLPPAAPTLAAGLKANSKDGALIAGQYIAVAEACFGDPPRYLTSEAKKFAKSAERQNERWYYEGYNVEAKGSTAYDEAFCNKVIFKLYEANGSDSRRLGFRL